MKKIFLVILASIVIATGCAKTPISAKETIVEHCVSISKSNDSSAIRKELAELEKMTKDNSLTEEDRMFAQYTYNISYGAVKVDLSGKAVSVFDFPEIELLSATVGAIGRGEMTMDETMLEESVNFLEKVEEFLK